MNVKFKARVYLQYILKTGGATVEEFDEDWTPIGPLVRAQLIPRFVVERNGKLELTEAGRKELK